MRPSRKAELQTASLYHAAMKPLSEQAWFVRTRHILGPILVLAVLSGALYLLYHELHKYHFHEIRQSLKQMPRSRLAACAALVAVNYLILIGYDLIAVRTLGHPLPFARVALASFAGFATSYNLGAIFGGTPVRARLYSSWGMSAAEIVRLILTIGITFWFGVFALAGAMFTFDPIPIPDAVPLPLATVRPIGIVLLVVIVGLFALSLGWRKPLRWKNREFALPSFRTLLLQFAVASADLAVASGSLFMLLPESVPLSYPQFLEVYVLAVVVVLFTHVPGGVGILELIILTFVASDGKREVLAALVAFRVIYYLIPLGLAFGLLLVHEGRQHAERAQAITRRAGQVLGGVTPTIVALLAMLAGAVLLFSGAAPPLPERLHFLRSLVPLPAMELSHFLASLVGLGLLILGRGLQRRLDAAWCGAVVLLVAGIVLSLVKGLDYEEALAAACVLAALVASRKRFFRKGSILRPSWSASWVAAVGVTLLCALWLGIFAHKRVEYSQELWWRFAFDADAPRFLRAQVGVAVVLLGFVLAKLVFGRAPVKIAMPIAEVLEQAAAVVAGSPRSSANLALLGDKLLLLNETNTAFIMYGVHGRSWISMGDPVGPVEESSELIWKFREECDRYDAWPAFYQIEADQIPLYLDHGFSLLKLGEEARVDAARFTLEGGSRRGLRQNRNRLQKEGCWFEIVPREGVPALLPTLKSISDAWLVEKQGAEKGFSLGFFDEAYLCRFPCALIRERDEIVAFANLWLAAGEEEFSVDLMRYRPGSARGIMDYLFVELILWGQTEGYHWFNLGMAPLSGIESRDLSPLWNKFASLLYRHGDQFYGFEGLRGYKDKFDPVWTPKYLAARGGLALPRILADVTALISRKR